MVRKQINAKSEPQPSRARGRPRAFYDSAEANHVRALDRALHVLSLLSEGKGMTLTELADISGESTSTVYRALLTMQKHNMVEYIETGQLWYVGVGAFRIGNAFLRRTSIVERSRPVMQAVMAETGETANLAVIEQMDVVFVSQVESHQPIRAFFRPGTRGPAHASGIGKALLAFMPEARIEALLKARDLASFTARTLVDPEALRADLRAIRARGWSIDDEERTEGMRCIAAPIFNAAGEAIAGISLSGPSVRVTAARDDDYGKRIARAAAEVTEAIGGKKPAL